jgi:hypothetical protein
MEGIYVREKKDRHDRGGVFRYSAFDAGGACSQ